MIENNDKNDEGVLARFWKNIGGENYCGPYYTGGRFNGVDGLPAKSGLDQLCREHDLAYSRGEHDQADHVFIREAKKFGPRGKFFRAYDGLEGYLQARPAPSYALKWRKE